MTQRAGRVPVLLVYLVDMTVLSYSPSLLHPDLSYPSLPEMGLKRNFKAVWKRFSSRLVQKPLLFIFFTLQGQVNRSSHQPDSSVLQCSGFLLRSSQSVKMKKIIRNIFS